MSKVLTDNSHFETKVRLRVDNLPRATVRVLDCFAGQGLIWREVQRRCPQKSIKVLSIDRKPCRGVVHLVGDNMKYLPGLDLNRFDVVDLDAYGIPYPQLRQLFRTKLKHKTVIFVTFIQSLYGQMPAGLLSDLGFTSTMIQKCPSLFNRRGFDKIKGWLANHGVRELRHYEDSSGRKHYFCFTLGA